jgi:dihydrolipoamide dehydrogenase
VPDLIKTDVVVIGAGVGGYSAAFRAADLGKRVVLVDQRDLLGGVCLQEGCIPSKALLHVAGLVTQNREMHRYGFECEEPKLDLGKINQWKTGIVKRLTSGLQFLAQRRNVIIKRGLASFVNANEITISTSEGEQQVAFSDAIIATGSKPSQLNFLPQDPRIIDSTAALDIDNPPKRLLIIGGGIIGLEMATIYHAIGVEVTVVETQSQLIPFADADLVMPLHKRLSERIKIHLNTKVVNVIAKPNELLVTFEGNSVAQRDPEAFDQILVSIGRMPNTEALALDKVAITTNDQGFIVVDSDLRTNVPHVYAIGDVIGQPMLAHKASYEGRSVAEMIAKYKQSNSAGQALIPSVAYTDPEIAWVGLTDKEAKAQGLDYESSVFPWVASGRAYTLNRTEGMTKLLFDSKNRRLLGAGIVGVHAGDLIAELTLAIRLQATAEQIADTIHPHPTLSESSMMAAEIFEGTATDVFMPKKEKEKE